MNDSFATTATSVREALLSQGFFRLVGAEVVAIEPGVVVTRVARRPELLQHNGLFHGGVLAFLIDVTTTAAAGTLVDRAKQLVLTAEYKLNLLSPSVGERLTCRAEVIKPGRRLTVVDAKVHCLTDGTEKPVAVALATIASLERDRAG
jgi:uncharacterized protein (TIGR00369 family)